jgi:hypothetical protein
MTSPAAVRHRSPGHRLARRAVLAYSIRNRRRKAGRIAAFIRERGLTSTLFVGSGGDRNANELVLEREIAAVTRIVAACDLYAATPGGWPYLRADGRALPFVDGAVDLVLSNAVIEHVGLAADQQSFVAEHDRVGRAWVITTPNRWFPVEAHTFTMFRHWRTAWRDSRREFTRLLSRREFVALLPPGTRVVGRPWSSTFIAFSAPRPGPARDRAGSPGREPAARG